MLHTTADVVRLLRGREVDARNGWNSANTRRDHVKRGTLTPPIRLSPGPTTPALWPEHEIEAILRARLAGKSEDDIRALVARLAADRQGSA